MKKIGLDQVTSWFIATLLSGGLTLGAYALLSKMAREPSELVLKKLEKEKKERGLKELANLEESRSEESTEGEPEWTYAGTAGPENWAQLSAKYSLCRIGREQSPVDINHAAVSEELPELDFQYGKQAFSLENTGRGFVGNFAQGGILNIRNSALELTHFDLHLPSEHSLDGIPFDMELQLSHVDSGGEVTKVALFIRESERDNPELSAIWSILSNKKGGDSMSSAIDLDRLLPKSKHYFSYMGSLSHPPCTEGVYWIVLEEPIEASSGQIDRFISMYRNNSRPVQGINKRRMLKSKSG